LEHKGPRLRPQDARDGIVTGWPRRLRRGALAPRARPRKGTRPNVFDLRSGVRPRPSPAENRNPRLNALALEKQIDGLG